MNKKHNSTDKDTSDSIWGRVVSWAKFFRVAPDYILNEISYQNLLLYTTAYPEFNTDKENGKNTDPKKDANNPDNFKDDEDEIDF